MAEESCAKTEQALRCLMLITNDNVYMKNQFGTLPWLIALFAVSLGVWTYIRAEGATITACARRNNGQLFLVDPEFRTRDCERNGKIISWNSIGAPGPKGDKGEKGDSGTEITNDSFYTMRHEPFEVQRNQTNTFGIGCENSNDVAIAGDPDILNATGGAIHWTVTQNRPDGWNNDSWASTVLYTGSDPTASFYINLKCMRVSQ